MSAAMWGLCEGFQNEFEIAVINEPSVFEPLKFYSTTVYESVCVTILRKFDDQNKQCLQF